LKNEDGSICPDIPLATFKTVILAPFLAGDYIYIDILNESCFYINQTSSEMQEMKVLFSTILKTMQNSMVSPYIVLPLTIYHPIYNLSRCKYLKLEHNFFIPTSFNVSR